MRKPAECIRMKRVMLAGFLALVMLGSLAGCRWLSEDASQSPTAPSDKSEQIANFYVNRGISDQIGVYIGREFFQVNAPAGDYLLTYTTNLGTFGIVFKAAEKALLNIGLQAGDELKEASLQKGTIPATLVNNSLFSSGYVPDVQFLHIITYCRGNADCITYLEPIGLPILIVKNGIIAVSEAVGELPEPDISPEPEPTPSRNGQPYLELNYSWGAPGDLDMELYEPDLSFSSKAHNGTTSIHTNDCASNTCSERIYIPAGAPQTGDYYVNVYWRSGPAQIATPTARTHSDSKTLVCAITPIGPASDAIAIVSFPDGTIINRRPDICVIQ